MNQRLLEHGLTAAGSVIVAGAGFFLLESRNHVTREEFQRHLDSTAPMVRQMDEDRGRVEARLVAIDARLIELSSVVKELARDVNHAGRGEGGR